MSRRDWDPRWYQQHGLPVPAHLARPRESWAEKVAAEMRQLGWADSKIEILAGGRLVRLSLGESVFSVTDTGDWEMRHSGQRSARGHFNDAVHRRIHLSRMRDNRNETSRDDWPDLA